MKFRPVAVINGPTGHEPFKTSRFTTADLHRMAQVFDHRKATPVIPLEPGLPTFGRMDLYDGAGDVRTGRHVHQLRGET